MLPRVAVVFALYLLSAWFGTQAEMPSTGLSLFWPAAGVSLAALLLWGPRQMLLPLLLGPLVVSAADGLPLPYAMLMGVANVLGPVCSLALWRRWRFSTTLSRQRDLYALLLLGGVLASIIGAVAGTVVLRLAGVLHPEQTLQGIGLWFGGDLVGTLVVAPAILALAHVSRGERLRELTPTWIDALLVLLAAGIAMLVFGTAGPPFSQWQAAFLFAPHVLLCVLALRANRALSAVLAAVLAVGSAWATCRELGPLADALTRPYLLSLWGYVASLGLMPLLVQAVRSEQRWERMRWHQAMEASGMGAADWRLPQGPTYRSPGWLALVGDAPHHGSGYPTDWLDAVHPVDRMRLSGLIQEALQAGGGNRVSETLRIQTPAQGWRWFDLQLHVQDRHWQGHATRVLATLTDTTWQRLADERKRLSMSLFQHASEGMLVTNAEHRVLDVNPSYCRILGLKRSDVIARLAAPLHPQALRLSGHEPQQVLATLERDGRWEGMVETLGGDHASHALQVSVARIPEPNGPVRLQVITVTDLSEQLFQRDQLARQARFDGLTGLHNSSAFIGLLREGIEQADAGDFLICVCCVDLDHFATLNERLGNTVGNQLLLEVAQRLRASLRRDAAWSDQLARVQGDNFALMLRCDDRAQALAAVERLMSVLRAPYLIGEPGQLQHVTASIGATLYPDDDSSAETLMRHAMHALYRAKRAGRDRHDLFDAVKRQRKEARAQALVRLQEALDHAELQLHYQPKVDMRHGRVLGAEALLRWAHPTRGLLTPTDFIDALEGSALALRVGEWVIEEALRQLHRWREMGLSYEVSVNLSAQQLQSPDFSGRLSALLAPYEPQLAQRLMLEVLESAALADTVATDRVLRECRQLGVRFALDDFGTGYATFTYLRQLAVDAVKIDRSFVHNMLANAQDRALVEGAIALAHSFGCTVVAEGVASRAHAQALLSMGCEQGQGFGIAPAMRAEDFTPWARDFESDPRLVENTL